MNNKQFQRTKIGQSSPDTINDWTDRQTKRASGTVVSDMWNVCLCVKFDCLIATIIACQVAFATIDAKILHDCMKSVMIDR